MSGDMSLSWSPAVLSGAARQNTAAFMATVASDGRLRRALLTAGSCTRPSLEKRTQTPQLVGGGEDTSEDAREEAEELTEAKQFSQFDGSGKVLPTTFFFYRFHFR
jgi:hypothetical protein